uniref:Uncharacterized protein n=1 Tax=Glossina palpalis gambiensis TaxID=67801 RepID=A0A1B0C527_9MUSC
MLAYEGQTCLGDQVGLISSQVIGFGYKRSVIQKLVLLIMCNVLSISIALLLRRSTFKKVTKGSCEIGERLGDTCTYAISNWRIFYLHRT